MTHHDTETTTAPRSPMLAGLDRLLDTVEEQVRSLREEVPGTERGAGPSAAGSTAAPTAPSAAHGLGANLEDLTVFMVRLKQMMEWLQQDQRLLTVVDDSIRQHVRKMERRVNALNLRIAFLTTVGGAVLGWLLSTVQGPSALLHILLHH
jgi:hypothetical protein